MKKIFTIIGLVAASIAGANAAVVINATGTNIVTENFNSFVGSAGTVPISTGFSVNDTGSTAWGYQGIGTGSSSTGGIYAFGASAADYSFGFLRSSNRAGGLQFDARNSTGGAIAGLTFTFNYEQWRFANTSGLTLSGVGALSSVNFSLYGFTGSATGTNGTPTSAPISITLTGLNIANGSTFGLAWTYVDQTGSDNGIAIDNFTLSASPVPEPSTWALIGLGSAFMIWNIRRRRAAKA